MLVQRREYICNYSSISLTNENNKTCLPDTLIDIMKNYRIVKDENKVYSSHIVAILDSPKEPQE